MNCGATRPCKTCQLSERNTVHTNISQFGHHDYVAPEESDVEGGMNLHEAICRLIVELEGFTDRPDYCMPPKIREAIKAFKTLWAISDAEIMRFYGEEN